tara:strand:+ start:453 stop:1259 length:807 start_codon:yes stop_codon:yes gene_type:complete
MTSWDVITPTSIGTGVAKTSLGTITKPEEVQSLIEFVPYYAPSGAITAGESMLLETALESNSVNLLPKRIINPVIASGLGATFSSAIPILEAWNCNTPLTAGATPSIEAFGQSQVANTVAPTMGCGFHWSNSSPSNPEMFYLKPDNESNTGTAATLVSGNTISINDGKVLQSVYGAIAPTTITASESWLGSMQFNSNDFDNSQAIEVPIQPMSVGIGALNSALNLKGSYYKNVSMGMKPTCTISPVLRLSEAVTVTGSWIGGVGYTKI